MQTQDKKTTMWDYIWYGGLLLGNIAGVLAFRRESKLFVDERKEKVDQPVLAKLNLSPEQSEALSKLTPQQRRAASSL